MINFNNISVRRIIMHTIHPKPVGIQNVRAYANYREDLFNIDPNVENIIKDRLRDAAGRRGKAFKLQIENTVENSFLGILQDLKLKDDNEFIQASKRIADLLAESQDKANYPGGFLLVIEAVQDGSNRSIYIAIKAEPHEALVSREERIERLTDIFLSPSQKLYKIGILHERTPEASEMNQRFDAYLFDDQFNTHGLPAEYFFKDFLGFSIDSNSEFQSVKFYRSTEQFVIKSTLLTSNQKSDALDALRTEFTNTTAIINPSEFGVNVFADPVVLSEYQSLVNTLPSRFSKDTTLVDAKLKTKRIDFPAKIKITGPGDEFDNKVKIVESQDQLSDLLVNGAGYTIVLISGHPFDNE